MEEIKFLYGFVRRGADESKPDGFIRVTRVDFKSSITEDQDSIITLFANKSEVYSGIIFKTSGLKPNDFVKVVYTSHSNENEIRNSKLIHGKVEIANRIYDLPDLKIENNFLDLSSNSFDYIRDLSTTNNAEFYIADTNYAYGPLKVKDSKIQPKESKEIGKYTIETSDFYLNPDTGEKYLTRAPSKKVALVDCMSAKQLLEHLKVLLRSSAKNNEDINRLSELYRSVNIEDDELQRNRINRIKKVIENIEFTSKEVYELSINEELWTSVFNRLYSEKLKEFQEYHWQDLKQQRETEEDNIRRLKLEAQKLREQKVELEELVDKIESKKDELIDSIRIQSLIQAPPSAEKVTEQFYDRIFNRVDHGLEGCLADYLSLIYEPINQDGYKSRIISWLKDLQQGKIFKVDDLEVFIEISNIFGSYEIYIQTPEIDWIKYESLHNNGLSQILRSSLDCPDIPHFYVLNNFNVASFELYAMPLIELLKNQRKHFPGTSYSFPSNLKIILIECLYLADDALSSEVSSLDGEIQSIEMKGLKLDRKTDGSLARAIKFQDIKNG